MRTALPALLLFATACGASEKKAETGPPKPVKPAEMQLPQPPAEAAATYKVRIWVDQDARRVADWKARVEGLLTRANAYLGPAFGVTLEGEIKEWERLAEPSVLLPILKELAGADLGSDVDWVIGVVAPLGAPEKAHHLLGLAPVPGRHLIVRLIDERNAAEIVQHKELVVFLHEWAHSAGALHGQDPTSVMALSYDLPVSHFSPTAVELARLGAKIRTAERSGDKAAAVELWARFADTLEKSPEKMLPEEKTPLLERARKLAAGKAGAGALSEKERAAFDAAAEAAKKGDRVAAANAIDELLANHPGDSGLKSAAASVYANAGAFSRAEALVQDPAAKARILASRRFYGLPPDAARFKVTPELEPEYVTMFDAAHEALSKKESKALAEKASAALRKFPGAPGLLALACAANFQFKRLPKAKAQCAEALAAWEETVLAHFFAGQIDPGPEGTKHFERVLELDPSLEAQVKPLLDKRKKK